MSRIGGMLRSFGPECPKCGCPMALTDAGLHGGRPWAKFKCEFCSGEQMVGRVPPPKGTTVGGPVAYQVVRCRCPYCQAVNPPVVSTPSTGVRWHKCDSCQKRFQSTEIK